MKPADGSRQAQERGGTQAEAGEAGVIVWFFQRYATYFAIFAGILAARTFVPEESSIWLGIAVGVPVTVTIYLLLYKDRVTANRPKRERNNPFR